MTASRTLYVAQKGEVVPWEIPVRDLEPNQVRVKVRSVGINPIDWKTIDNRLADGTGQGNDFAGEVVEIGSEVKSVRVGDTVAGGVGGGDVDRKENGAFTPLLNVEEHLLFKFPTTLVDADSDKLTSDVPRTFQQAASLGIALDTSAIAFSNRKPKDSDEWALIYGGASSLGFIAAQYARNIGYNVIVVSAPHDELFKDIFINFLDRNDPEWPTKAKELSGGRVKFVLDAIGLGDSAQKCFEAVAEDGLLSFADPALSVPAEVCATKPDVVIEHPLYFLLMQPVKKFGATALPNHEGYFYENAHSHVGEINGQLRRNEILTLPITVLQGLDKIAEGLDINRKGVSGTKIVINV